MPRTTTVHLLQGDWPDRLDQAKAAAVAAAEDTIPRTALEADPYETLAAEYEAMKAEALADAITIHLTAIGRRKWRALKEKYPPRKEPDADKATAESDRVAGVNLDAVEDDLVYESVKAWQDESGETVPYASSRPAFDEWADNLSEGEWAVLTTKAWYLANGARLDPKDHLPPSRTVNGS